ncbi:hypothetical protein QR685DRAFT_431887 [Neurospora intermedia]|uniref:Uncharacterized protein n=1 Tax=Neurospora intermedia TaxID=5142 RepID=A0ABR3DRE8_NEUIN
MAKKGPTQLKCGGGQASFSLLLVLVQAVIVALHGLSTQPPNTPIGHILAFWNWRCLPATPLPGCKRLAQ